MRRALIALVLLVPFVAMCGASKPTTSQPAQYTYKRGALCMDDVRGVWYITTGTCVPPAYAAAPPSDAGVLD